MKKRLIPALLLGFASSAFANVPAQFHGCWSMLYLDEIPVQLNISANKITQAADEQYYEGKVLSVKQSGGTYIVKTKGKMDGSPFSREFKLKRSGKALFDGNDKLTKCE